MKISGIMPLRNAVKLGYPFELALKSLRLLVDELVVLVDPMSEDDTLARVKTLSPDVLVESVWDMTNHRGHTNCEITIQTQKALDACSGDWVFSLQADEILHEGEIETLRFVIEHEDHSALALKRLYFYGSLGRIRLDWSQKLVRAFRRGLWKPDVDGAMKFEPINPGEEFCVTGVPIFHYSRVGDPEIISERIRNLDGFFHDPSKISSGVGRTYDFIPRAFDTYAVDENPALVEPTFVNFPLDGHPQGVREWFGQ